MKRIPDLQIIQYDEIFAAGNKVALRYTAEGSHSGEEYQSPKKSMQSSSGQPN